MSYTTLEMKNLGDDMLTLYHNDMSVCAQKVRLALEEKGASWESRHLSLVNNEAKTPDYLRLNPAGVVPTLIDHDVVITESNVIVEYIEDAVRGPSLRPPSPPDRARMRWWLKQLDEDIHKSTGILSGAVAFRHQGRAHYSNDALRARAANAKPDEAAFILGFIEVNDRGVEAGVCRPALARFDRMLKDMQAALEAGPWLAGREYSLADVGYAPYITRLAHLRFERWWDDKPNIAEWFARIQTRPAYGQALTAWFNQDYLALMAEKGPDAWIATKRVLAEG